MVFFKGLPVVARDEAESDVEISRKRCNIESWCQQRAVVLWPRKKLKMFDFH